jgi:hypothetical protein
MCRWRARLLGLENDLATGLGAAHAINILNAAVDAVPRGGQTCWTFFSNGVARFLAQIYKRTGDLESLRPVAQKFADAVQAAMSPGAWPFDLHVQRAFAELGLVAPDGLGRPSGG